MALDYHRQAESFMSQADHEDRLGNRDAARELYSRAADAELAALERLAPNQLRTRAVVAVSAVALYHRADRFEDGLAVAYRMLGDGSLPLPAEAELEALLDELRTRRAAARMGLVAPTDQFEWVFRGRGVGAGVASLDLIARKIGQIEKLGVRVYEFLAGQPLRKQGPPDPSVEAGLKILIGQPAAGSFRFGFRFARSEQQLTLPTPEFQPERSKIIEPASLAGTFATVIEVAREPDDEEKLAAAIPPEDYRNAFLKLVRNLVPDGAEVREIELQRASDGRTVTRLVPATRNAITRHLRQQRKPRRDEEPSAATDILRAVQLNEGWIALGKEPEQRFHVPDELALEDVIGPLVNQRVRVSFHRERNALYADDIEPAGDDSQDDSSE